jgi:anti-sigma B factor antagonist
MLFDIDQRKVEPDITVLAFKGRITLGRENQRLETMVKDLQRAGVRKLVFDLAQVDYLDSAGLGILTYCYATMKNAGGGFRISGVTGKVLQLMKFTKLDSFLPLFPTVDAACRDFTL